MTAHNDLDRTLGGWFGDETAAALPPEQLARIIETTRGRRPRPKLVAGFGSEWVDDSTSGVLGATATLRPALVIALIALLAVALVGAAVLVGSRLLVPPPAPQSVAQEFVSAPGLSRSMAQPLLALLPDGRLLVIGRGSQGEDQTLSAELYVPASGTSRPVGPMVRVRYVDSATPLRDGRVLIIGEGGVAQVFDPDEMRFAPVGPMVTPRRAATALLHDGRVLIIGDDIADGGVPLRTAELFDPETLTFSATGSMGTSGSRLATLPDGRVFVASDDQSAAAQVYDPSIGAFSTAGTMPQFDVAATIALPDGRVVVFGSSRIRKPGQRNAPLGAPRQGNAAVWDSTTLTFSPAGDPPGPVVGATLLDDGRILLIGGAAKIPVVGEAADHGWAGMYDPATGATVPIEPPAAWQPSLARLDDGRVIAVGGLRDGAFHLGPDGAWWDAPAVPTVQIFR